MQFPDQWRLTEADLPDLAGKSSPKKGEVALRTSREKDTINYQAVMTNSIEPGTFLRFLNGIAPKKIDYPGVISADWEMPDEKSEESIRLQRVHEKGLKGFWELFSRHRRRFMRALNVDESLDNYGLVASKFKTEEHIATNAMDFIQSRQDCLFLLMRLKEENEPLLHSLLESWRTAGKKRKRKNKKPAHNDFDEWNAMYMKKALDYLHNFGLADEMNRIAYELKEERIRQRRNETTMKIPHPVTGEALYVRLNENGEFLRRARAAVSGTTVSGNGYMARSVLTATETELHAHLHVLENQKSFRSRLFPLIQWTRDEHGGRKWNYDFLDQESLSSLQPHLANTMNMRYDRRQIDPLIGLMSVASARADIRKNWPERLSLPHSTFQQVVGPAQIPVFVAMKEGEILQSNTLLAGLEEQADSM